MGEELPDELIILPEPGTKSAGRNRPVHSVKWPPEALLEVFPNPASNTAYIVLDVGVSSEIANLRLLDLNGRQLRTQQFSGAQGIVTLSLEGLSPGLYLIEFVRTEEPSLQARLVVQ